MLHCFLLCSVEPPGILILTYTDRRKHANTHRNTQNSNVVTGSRDASCGFVMKPQVSTCWSCTHVLNGDLDNSWRRYCRLFGVLWVYRFIHYYKLMDQSYLASGHRICICACVLQVTGLKLNMTCAPYYSSSLIQQHSSICGFRAFVCHFVVAVTDYYSSTSYFLIVCKIQHQKY